MMQTMFWRSMLRSFAKPRSLSKSNHRPVRKCEKESWILLLNFPGWFLRLIKKFEHTLTPAHIEIVWHTNGPLMYPCMSIHKHIGVDMAADSIVPYLQSCARRAISQPMPG